MYILKLATKNNSTYAVPFPCNMFPVRVVKVSLFQNDFLVVKSK